MKSNSATDLNIQFELLFRSFVCLFAIFKTLKTIMVNTVTIIGLRKSIGKHAKSFYHTHQTKWKATLYLHFVHSTFSFHSLHSTALHWIALNWYVNFLAQTESKWKADIVDSFPGNFSIELWQNNVPKTSSYHFTYWFPFQRQIIIADNAHEKITLNTHNALLFSIDKLSFAGISHCVRLPIASWFDAAAAAATAADAQT